MTSVWTHGGVQGHTLRLGKAHAGAIVLQKKIIELAKKQQTPDAGAEENADASQLGPDLSGISDDNAQLQEVEAVPAPGAVLGPAHVAWQLLTENTCTGEQTDAVALLALCLQRKFGKRPDKTTHILPTCEASGNHRAVWLGGGGADKHTHLLRWCNPWPKPTSAQTGSVPAPRAITPRRTSALAAAPSTLRTVCSWPTRCRRAGCASTPGRNRRLTTWWGT